jgi:hypothetical protein
MVCISWALATAIIVLDVCFLAAESQAHSATPQQRRLLRASKRPNRIPLKVFAASFVTKADEDVSTSMHYVMTA